MTRFSLSKISILHFFYPRLVNKSRQQPQSGWRPLSVGHSKDGGISLHKLIIHFVSSLITLHTNTHPYMRAHKINLDFSINFAGKLDALAVIP